MKRPFFVATFFFAATAVLAAQEASQSSPYQGVSNPPQDDIITTETPQPTQAKPPAGHPMNAEPAAPARPLNAVPPPAVAPPMQDRSMNIGTDDGIVQPQAMPRDTRPSLADQAYVPGPDDGIVHLAPLGPGELREGTMIRVRLENDLSSAWSDEGQTFKSRVASDVVEGGQVVIPAGAEISGKVVDVSTGHFGGHGTLMLHPDTVTMPSGESFQLHAMVEGAPGTHTRVDAEGVISPDSQKKKDGIEYGGVVGGGVIVGAVIGGPVGALAGGLIGAGVVTTHLLVNHPQAHLDQGDVLMLTLTEQMHLVPASVRGE
jgi:hypothetical protein